MALDKETAQRLWDDRYRQELESFSYKNKYLHPTGDPEDLFQDMWINVWTKAVNYFDADKTTFAGGDVDRAFNAFVHQIMNQYFANLKKHQETGKQQWERSVKSADEPMRGEEGEGPTLLDRFEDLTRADEDPELAIDLQNLYNSLPEDLAEPLRYIVEHAEAGNFSQVMKDIRDKWGWTKTRLFNALIEEPEFLEFVENV